MLCVGAQKKRTYLLWIHFCHRSIIYTHPSDHSGVTDDSDSFYRQEFNSSLNFCTKEKQDYICTYINIKMYNGILQCCVSVHIYIKYILYVFILIQGPELTRTYWPCWCQRWQRQTSRNTIQPRERQAFLQKLKKSKTYVYFYIYTYNILLRSLQPMYILIMNSQLLFMKI